MFVVSWKNKVQFERKMEGLSDTADNLYDLIRFDCINWPKPKDLPDAVLIAILMLKSMASGMRTEQQKRIEVVSGVPPVGAFTFDKVRAKVKNVIEIRHGQYLQFLLVVRQIVEQSNPVMRISQRHSLRRVLFHNEKSGVGLDAVARQEPCPADGPAPGWHRKHGILGWSMTDACTRRFTMIHATWVGNGGCSAI